jgi:hypothetical protein
VPFSLFKFVALHNPVAHFQSLDPCICGFGIIYSNNLSIFKFSFLYALNMGIIKFKKNCELFHNQTGLAGSSKKIKPTCHCLDTLLHLPPMMTHE